MATQPGDKVKLETIASLGSIPSTTRREDFAVLVRVTAPPAGVSTGQRRSSLAGGVDLVAVLDVSESMKEDNKLQRMKKAMIFVIDKLGLGDRLAVVAFNGEQVQRLTELSMMSDKKNRADAKSEVQKLIAGGARGGDTNLSAAMEAAAAILGQREEGESNNRVGRIIFLSNGDDDTDGGSSPELAAEAFALGADHDPNAMIFSKEKTSGVYTYANQDLDRIKDADSIRGLTSVDAAIGVQVDLQAHDGVAISALESGGRRVSVAGGGADDGRQSGLTVYIHDLYAGEQKRFIVYLTVPEGKKEQLLTAGGRYGDPENSTGGYNSRLDDSKVSVLRPDDGSSSPGDEDETTSPKVAEEFARARLPKGGAVPVPATENKAYWWRVLPCVVVLLILAALLVGNMSEEEEEGNKSGSQLDISQHPGWPKMEESLDATMLEMIEDVGIRPLLHGAQVDDMSRTMNRYIYLALAHASVLGSLYGPVSGKDGVSVLEQTVERLEAEKEELLIKFVALGEEKVSEETETVAAGCTASKQEALERANTLIAELERQLHDKKAFADSLLSEVANADAHIKTCGQRAEMLEIKVRELEGADAE